MNKYHLFIICAAILWGIDGLLRTNLYSLPPVVVVFWEHLIGFCILFVITRIVQRKTLSTESFFDAKTLKALIFVSLFSGLIGTVAFTAALAKTNFIPISIVFLIQKLQPIFTITASAIFLKEYPKRIFWLWSSVALISGYFMTFPGGYILFDANSEHLTAALLALLAAFGWGISTVFSKYALTRKDPASVTLARFALTTVFALVAVFIFGAQSSMVQVSATQFSYLLIIALSTGMVGVVIYYKGLQKVPAHVSCILELAFPLTGIVADVLAKHANLSISQYIAAAVLIYAAYRISLLSTIKK